MQGYKRIRDDLPDRIMSMAEKEQNNSFALRNGLINGRLEIQRRDARYDMHALYACTALCALFILGATLLFYAGRNTAAVFFCVAAFITLPKTYLKPREKKQDK